MTGPTGNVYLPTYRIIGVIDMSSDPVDEFGTGLLLCRKEYYFGAHIGENVVLEGVDTLRTDKKSSPSLTDYELDAELIAAMINAFERLDEEKYKGVQLALGQALAFLALPLETPVHSRRRIIVRASPKKEGV